MVRKLKLTAFILAAIMVLWLWPGGEVRAEENPFTQGYIEGYWLEVQSSPEGTNFLALIESYQGQNYLIAISPTVNCSIDRRPVSLKEIRPGMEIYAQLQGRQINAIEAYSTVNMGYLSPGAKVRKGNITHIDRDQIEIMRGDGTREVYFTTSATIILRKGQIVPADSLYRGDRVKLFFDELHTNLISRMEIEGDSILVKGLYKGTLAYADGIGNKLIIENLQVFRNGSWQKDRPTWPVPHDSDILMYIGGQKVMPKNLKYYQGQTVFLVSREIMGREKAERIVIKNQYESHFSDKIKTLNWYTDMFELADHQNISINEGSIIIKNGRLQDRYALDVNDDAFILVDGRGDSRMAGIIYVYNEDVNHSNSGQHYLYAGKLDEVFQDQIRIKDFFLLNGHEWDSFDKDKQFFYDHDTCIVDLETGRRLAAEEFYVGDYAVDEDSDRSREYDLKNWYAYIYSDGDRVVAIGVEKDQDSLLRQRITTGRVGVVNDDPLVGWTIVLNDAADWSARKDQWMPRSSTIRINQEQALLIKNNQIIDYGEIKPGDRLYIVRDDFNARVIIVK
ncbi:hypothetical protein ACU70A_06075 [Syntrophomonas erecta subsp. sporosyntropha]